jgi:hypothetical protein
VDCHGCILRLEVDQSERHSRRYDTKEGSGQLSRRDKVLEYPRHGRLLSRQAVSRWLLVVPTCLSPCYMNKGIGKQEVASRVKPVDNGGAPAQGHPRPVAKNMGERDKLQFAGPARGKSTLRRVQGRGTRRVQCTKCYLQVVLTRDHLHFSLPIYIHAPTGASLAVVTRF